MDLLLHVYAVSCKRRSSKQKKCTNASLCACPPSRIPCFQKQMQHITGHWWYHSGKAQVDGDEKTLSGSLMNSSWRFSSVENRRHGHMSIWRHGHISMRGSSELSWSTCDSPWAEQRSLLSPDVSAGPWWWRGGGGWAGHSTSKWLCCLTDSVDSGETTALIWSDLPPLDSDFSRPSNFWSKSSGSVSTWEN